MKPKTPVDVSDQFRKSGMVLIDPYLTGYLNEHTKLATSLKEGEETNP